MELTTFIKDLLGSGTVCIKRMLTPFSEEDLQAARNVLYEYYQQDILDMPHTAPAYSDEAAIWAARYFYQSLQLTVIREAGEELIEETLTDYHGPITPEAIYSADLILRHLPSLFRLSKGLAPGDILVKKLSDTAAKWPFSSVGIDPETTVYDTVILAHPSLKQAYIDRIIEQKDSKRINSPETRNYLRETTGDYLPVLWPEFETGLKTDT